LINLEDNDPLTHRINACTIEVQRTTAHTRPT